MNDLDAIRKDIQKAANPQKGQFLQRFFKTGVGEYAFGDVFLGLTVPQSRKIASKYKDLTFLDIETLLSSAFHEERLIALFLLVSAFQSAKDENKKRIVDIYLKNTRYINNWDLVDCSADKIIGEYVVMIEKSDLLLKMAKSKNLWEKRIAILSTFAFIKKKKFRETFAVSEVLLNDSHDLIHKAVGWMLREVGKRISEEIEEAFLRKHYKKMPRTMLRYAIERFAVKKRLKYLNGKV